MPDRAHSGNLVRYPRYISRIIFIQKSDLRNTLCSVGCGSSRIRRCTAPHPGSPNTLPASAVLYITTCSDFPSPFYMEALARVSLGRFALVLLIRLIFTRPSHHGHVGSLTISALTSSNSSSWCADSGTSAAPDSLSGLLECLRRRCFRISLHKPTRC
jgi:hypothetical protein